MAQNVSSNVFMVKEVKLYGLYSKPLYDKEKGFYFQSIFLEGDVKGNLSFIEICPKNYPKGMIKSENKNFLSKILKLFNGIVLQDYDKRKSYDNEEFLLHGENAKVLLFFDEIVALSEGKECYWIPTSNFFTTITDINVLKKKLIQSKINECNNELEIIAMSEECNYDKYLHYRDLRDKLISIELNYY